jgi:hypothetical protein
MISRLTRFRPSISQNLGVSFQYNLPFDKHALGTPGNANRRSFIGPGEINFDLIRPVAFNAFNHANFFRPLAVNGDISTNLFGQVANAAPPREKQIAAKLYF